MSDKAKLWTEFYDLLKDMEELTQAYEMADEPEIRDNLLEAYLMVSKKMEEVVKFLP